MNKESFGAMVSDWLADNAEEAENLKISEPYFDNELGWIADAEDDKAEYSLTDDGFGNIALNYVGTK